MVNKKVYLVEVILIVGLVFAFVAVASSVIVSAEIVSSTTSTNFHVDYVKYECILPDKNRDQFPENSYPGPSYWKSLTAEAYDSSEACESPQAGSVYYKGGEATECCKEGFNCIDNKCKIQPKTRCEDFLTEPECLANDKNYGVVGAQLESITDSVKYPGGCQSFSKENGKCLETIDCRCRWDPVEKCIPTSNHIFTFNDVNGPVRYDYDDNVDIIASECNVPVQDLGGTFGKCTFVFTYSGSCEKGDDVIRRSWTTSYDPPELQNEFDYCKDGFELIPCERVIRLGFFDLQNVIVAIILLVVIYYFFIRQKKK